MKSTKTFLPLLALALPAAALAQPYDVLIRGGQVLDGSGRPGYRADVAIAKGRIAKVGDLSNAMATTVVDATGRYVTPGFLNIHSHAQQDGVATAENMLGQGVTTEFINADGYGTDNLTTQLAEFGGKGLALNIGGLAGFNALWAQVVGAEDRKPNDAEIARMRDIMAANMAKGAWGVSAGLDYKPGYFASQADVIRVVSVARPWRTHFTNHDRLRPEENYSSNRGVAETIAIGEGAGLFPNATHVKSQGAEQGRAAEIVGMLKAATARGYTGTTDVYPYLAGQSGLGALTIPGWALDGGREAMLKRFKDPATRARVIAEAERAMALRFGGPKGVYEAQENQPLTTYMARWNVGAGEALIRLLEEKDRGAILHFGAEPDLETFLRYPGSAISCDCGAAPGVFNLGGGPSRISHPRYYGTFPRVLGRYVRDMKLLSWEQAVLQMTALPAQITGAVDRGLLAPGMAADVVVFDPATVMDHATYEAPTTPSTGIDTVLVNGVVSIAGGKATGKQGGAAILRSSHMPSRPLEPLATGRMSGAGKLADGAWTLAFDISQSATDPRAKGRLTLAGPGGQWTASDLGLVQTTRDGWGTVSAVLRNAEGQSASVVLIGDPKDPTQPQAGPTLSVLMDGRTLTGRADRLSVSR